MNQVFSFQRYWLLLKLDFAENGRRNALIFGVLFGLMLIMMSPVIDYRKFGFDPIVFHVLAYFMITFCTSLFTSLVFDKYASSNTGINAILIPASQTEKYLAALAANLTFATALIALYVGMHIWFVEILEKEIPGIINKKFHPSFIQLLVYTFFLIQSVCFLGSIYFKKAAYIKTATVFFSALIVFSLINRTYVRNFTNEDPSVSAVPFGQWNVMGRNSMFLIEYSQSTFLLIKIFLVFFVLALWYIAFVRLKEKEI
ncbi:hypothetical protein SAMN04487995_5868 [Dyadobacter koreensis]|uniref:ABC-2 family transporter protein n=1 Tax=Dyadobacter koreensis TaxID=408657 RepID=A0A1H7B0Y8_9BACT|nr:hypothetical protein [Dyadobacter koreensis]SEJ68042.1 hypothetical protein SAMN04487995_5868 [Dyadobacter koreensis]